MVDCKERGCIISYRYKTTKYTKSLHKAHKVLYVCELPLWFFVFSLRSLWLIFLLRQLFSEL